MYLKLFYNKLTNNTINNKNNTIPDISIKFSEADFKCKHNKLNIDSPNKQWKEI